MDQMVTRLHKLTPIDFVTMSLIPKKRYAQRSRNDKDLSARNDSRLILGLRKAYNSL
jgi:hypothetical protein